MKDVHVVGKKMTRNAGKMAKLIGCAFRFETEFTKRLKLNGRYLDHYLEPDPISNSVL